MNERPDVSAGRIWANVWIIVGVAITWTLLFRFNGILFQELENTRFGSWIFLPAAIRILSVLLFGWPAVIGLITGAFITGNHDPGADQGQVLVIATLSGIAPFVAVSACSKALRIKPELAGLSAVHLLILSIVGAMANTLILNGYLIAADEPRITAAHLTTVFVGDMVGTAIILYAAALLAWLVSRGD